MLQNTTQIKSFKHLNNKKIAIVVAKFNQTVTEGLLNGALRVLQENQFSKENYKVFKVPGSVEIPLITQKIGGWRYRYKTKCLSYSNNSPGSSDHEGHARSEVAAARAHIKGPHPRLQVLLQNL